jgi:hypothetical protein
VALGVGDAVGAAPAVTLTTGAAADTLDAAPPPLQPLETARTANVTNQETRGMGKSPRSEPNYVQLRVRLDHCAQRALTEI